VGGYLLGAVSERIAKLLVGRTRALLIVSALATVLLMLPALDAPERLELGNGSLAGSESEEAAERLGDELGFEPRAAYVLLVEADPALADDTVAVALRALRSQIEGIERVGRAGKAAKAPSGELAIAVYLEQGADTEGTLEVGQALREDLDPGPLTVMVAGEAAVSESARAELTGEVLGLELVVVPFVFFVLAVALGLRLAFAVLLGALLSVAAALTVLSASAGIFTLQVAAVPVAAAVAFTAAVALAAALARRNDEEAASIGAGADALGCSLAIVLRGALAAALAAAILLGAALVIEFGVVASIAAGAAIATIVAPLALLPAGAAIAAASREPATTLPLVGSDPKAPLPAEAPGAFKRAVGVARTRRRALLATLTAAGALLLALPLIGVDGVGIDATDLGEGEEARSAEEVLGSSFAAGATAPLVAVTEGPADSAEIADQRDAATELAGVAEVTPAGNAAALARFTVITDSAPRSLEAQRTAQRFRDLDLAGAPELTGPGAELADAGSRLDSRLALAGAGALVAVMLLWALLLGRALGAALALAATLGPLAGAGIVAWVFSEGALEGLVGYEPAGAPDLLSPLIVLAILLPVCLTTAAQQAAALREERLLGGGAIGAVARSVALTGPAALTASACGLAIAIVWLGSELTVAREIALGVAAGLLVEALIVRALVAPGLARLLWR
jgi:uncharacterized membrane protein YdfJ with MMPL/SSD domain